MKNNNFCTQLLLLFTFFALSFYINRRIEKRSLTNVQKSYKLSLRIALSWTFFTHLNIIIAHLFYFHLIMCNLCNISAHSKCAVNQKQRNLGPSLFMWPRTFINLGLKIYTLNQTQILLWFLILYQKSSKSAFITVFHFKLTFWICVCILLLCSWETNFKCWY